MDNILPNLNIEKTLDNFRNILVSRKLWRGNGEYTKEFEKRFALMCNKKYGVGFTNGSHALEGALNALKAASIFKEGKNEVIIPSFAFIAVSGAVLNQGFIPVPVDINPDDYNINTNSVIEALNNRTCAIIAVHFAGVACNLTKLKEIAKENHIILIEDAAQAHFATYENKPVGSYGDLSSFSFQAAKTMTSGEGGIVLTNDNLFRSQLEKYINYGRDPSDSGYNHEFLSSNFRISEFESAILLPQLENIEKENNYRKKRFNELKNLINIDDLVYQKINEKDICSFSLFPLYNEKWEDEEYKYNIISKLNSHGYMAKEAYPQLSNTKLLQSAILQGKLDENKKEYIMSLDKKCIHASNLIKKLININHSIFYKNNDDIKKFSKILREA